MSNDPAKKDVRRSTGGDRYKSKFERRLAVGFRKAKLGFQYEPKRFKFTQPAIERVYTPDWWLPDVGVYVESKGKLTPEERKKLVWWRQAHPDVPFVLIFQRARNPIRKGSKTTYGDWATKNNFIWFDFQEFEKFKEWVKQQKYVLNADEKK